MCLVLLKMRQMAEKFSSHQTQTVDVYSSFKVEFLKHSLLVSTLFCFINKSLPFFFFCIEFLTQLSIALIMLPVNFEGQHTDVFPKA